MFFLKLITLPPDLDVEASPPMVSLQPSLDNPTRGLLMRLPNPPAGGPDPDSPGPAGVTAPTPSWYTRPEMLPFLSLCSRLDNNFNLLQCRLSKCRLRKCVLQNDDFHVNFQNTNFQNINFPFDDFHNINLILAIRISSFLVDKNKFFLSR
jgi:hypothetical protein